MKKIIWLVLALIVVAVAVSSIIFLMPEKNVPQEENNNPENSDIRVFLPKPEELVKSPLQVSGEARGTWFFEASFPIKIIDEAGNVLGTSYVQAESDWMTENFVPFKGEINYLLKTRTNGFLVLAKDNPSGLQENDKEIRIPIILDPSETIKVKVYFNNSKLDPEASCNKVFPAERDILKVEAVGSAAVWELLRGPTDEEAVSGFFTSINTGVRLQGLEINKDGIAKVDFDDNLEKAVGGSCRVSAIRAQITETLKQFPTIKNVVISINGRTEDILQP